MWKRKLLKNKLYSIILIILGVIPILIDGDGTFFVFTLIIGIPLFFAKKNWIMDGGCGVDIIEWNKKGDVYER